MTPIAHDEELVADVDQGVGEFVDFEDVERELLCSAREAGLSVLPALDDSGWR